MALAVGARQRAWLRENLFASPATSVASALAFAVALWLFAGALQWLILDAYWAGSTPQACPDKGAACWPFIRARLDQFLYGFYPVAERWRIDAGLALGAGFVALVVWRPFRIPVWCALLAGYASLALALALFRGGWAGLVSVSTAQWGGAFLTLVTVATVFALALPAGVLLALGRASPLPLVRALCSFWIEFWRGVPALVVLFIATIMFPLFMPAGFGMDKLLRAQLAMAILMSCYLAEAVRGGLASVPAGQLEACHALGLGYWRRNFLVVLPQALAASLPQIASNLIGLSKETTLLLVIGIPDLLGMVNASASDPAWLGEGVLMTGYAFTAAIFWTFCFGLSLCSRRIERRLTVHRAQKG